MGKCTEREKKRTKDRAQGSSLEQRATKGDETTRGKSRALTRQEGAQYVAEEVDELVSK